MFLCLRNILCAAICFSIVFATDSIGIHDYMDGWFFRKQGWAAVVLTVAWVELGWGEVELGLGE